jgi:predicted metal-binding membrane protein
MLQRLGLIGSLAVVTVVSWAWIVVMARDMYGSMTGASAWMMTPHWDAPHLLLLWAMWAVMMTAMMLPSATPIVLLTARAAPHQTTEASSREAAALAGGYVTVWALFSIGATLLQWALGRMFILNPMMEASNRTVAGAFLLIAGAYQWTPLKTACLTTCQSPMAFLARRWRSGTSGAFRMGLEHGVYCVGCCWALMLLLFAGGVMNLWVIAALTVFVGFEKLVPLGAWGARGSGALLIVLGIWMLAV